MSSIPIIDLFAGPGGLGEGFSQFERTGANAYKIALSIEKDKYAHETLKLRSFFRNFNSKSVPDEYYNFIQGKISKDELFDLFHHEHDLADKEAWLTELGSVDDNELDRRLEQSIGSADRWVLIGGPPCQAYSTAGRSRNKGIKNYRPEKDKRHFLYRQYLRIIAYHWPSVFIMENVRGILSSKINGKRIFPEILKDLQRPADVFNGEYNRKKHSYRIFSLVKSPDDFSSNGNPLYKNFSDFTIKCEEHGVPQARHRVILLGVRDDFCSPPYPILKQTPPVSVKKVIGELPKLRGGFSRGQDDKERWFHWLDQIIEEDWYLRLKTDPEKTDVAECIFNANLDLKRPEEGRGGEFIECGVKSGYLPEWYLDGKIKGVCNSTTRTHMDRDLYRYFYAACFAKAKKRSPILNEFPYELLPEHKSAKKVTGHGNFADRFRVQVSLKPSTTIMSHISKDGHYYIHYDPTQCRSLTVREVARLQTFPDNYFFCGSRTQQYVQVGNAVPPYLAHQIADIVYQIISKTKSENDNGQSDKRETKLEYVPN